MFFSFRCQTGRAVLYFVAAFILLAPAAHAEWHRLPYPRRTASEYFRDIDFRNANDGFALLQSAFDHRLLSTSDGGFTWDVVSTGTQGVFASVGKIHFFDALNGYLHTNSSDALLSRTTDGGLTFTPLDSPFGNTDIRSAHFFSPDRFWVGPDSAFPRMLAFTEDAGSTWTFSALPRNILPYDIFFLPDEQHGWITGDGLLFYTRDGGATWGMGNLPNTQRYLVVRMFDSQIGWAGGRSGQLLYTNDGGLNWYRQDSGTDRDINDLLVLSPTEAIAATGSGEQGEILSTVNGGATWRIENTRGVEQNYGLDLADGVIFAAGGYNSATQVQTHLLRRSVNPGVSEGTSPFIVARELPGGTADVEYAGRAFVVNGAPPYTWSVSSGVLPAGVTLTSSTGILSGVPISPGFSFFSLTVTDDNGESDARDFFVTIQSDKLQLFSETLASATHRKTFQQSIDFVGGTPPLTWRVVDGSLPRGMSVDAQGVIAGTPSELGTFNFTVEVTDSNALTQRAAALFSLTVEPLETAGWEIQHTNNRIRAIHFFDELHGLAVGWSGVLYETHDGGRVWTFRNIGAREADILYFFGDLGFVWGAGGFFRSADAGATWTRLTGAIPDDIVKLDFISPLKGWSAGDSIYYTEDGGLTWTRATSMPPNRYYYAIAMRDELNGYAGGIDTAFDVTADGGRTWTPASLPAFPQSLASPSTAGPVRTRLAPTPGFAPRPRGTGVGNDQLIPDVSGIHFRSSSQGWVGTQKQASAGRITLYATTNGGANWSQQIVTSRGNHDLFDFIDERIGWSSGLFNDYLFRTSNGGATWNRLRIGGGTEHFHVGGLDLINERLGFMTCNVTGKLVDNGDGTASIYDMEGSIWRSTDGGVTFEQSYGWPTERVPLDGNFFIGVQEALGPMFDYVHFLNEDMGWALAHASRQANFDRLLFTDTGGARWEIRSIVDRTAGFAFRNQFEGFMLPVGGSSLLETSDGGRNWRPRPDVTYLGTQLTAPPMIGRWDDVFFLNSQVGWIVMLATQQIATGPQHIIGTTDGGRTWQHLREDPLTNGLGNRLFFLDEDRGWLYGRGGRIQFTHNGGSSWTQQRASSSEFDLVDLAFADEFNGWAVTDDGRYLSTTDGGQNWSAPMSSGLRAFKQVQMLSCSVGWLVGAAGETVTATGRPVIRPTEDGSFADLPDVEVDLGNANLTQIDSPDMVNAWAFGDWGTLLKYAAPTDAIMVATAGLDNGRVDTPYSAQLEAANATAPLAWHLCGGAPEGITLSAGGLLAGTPTRAGTYRLAVEVLDAGDRIAARRLELTIEPALSPTIQTDALPDGTVLIDYAAPLAAAGTPSPYRWFHESGDLPPGLQLFQYGLIGGIPTAPGEYSFTVRVTDDQAPVGSARKTFTLNINGQFAPRRFGDVVNYLLGVTNDPTDLDFNEDTKIDSGDVIDGVNRGL